MLKSRSIFSVILSLIIIFGTNLVQSAELGLTTLASGRVWNTGVEGDSAYIEVYYNRNYTGDSLIRSKKNGIAEFDISAIPVGSIINSVQLTITTKFNNAAGEIEIQGYLADGIFNLSDYGSGSSLIATFMPYPTAGSVNLVNLNIELLQTAVDSSEPFFGLEFDQIAALNGASSIGASFESTPVLTINYTDPTTFTSIVSGRVWNTGIEGDSAYIEVYYNRNYTGDSLIRSKKNGIAEFDISTIPLGSVINSLQLKLLTKFNNAAGEIDVKSYLANGIFEQSDYGRGSGSLATFIPNPLAGASNIINLNVDTLQATVDSGEQFFGLEFDQIAALNGASSIGASFESYPVLTVNSTYPEIELDSDNDGIPDNVDNAPNIANHDQSDIDEDGIADVIDSCPSDINNLCDATMSAASSIGDDGGDIVTAQGNTAVSIPAGALTTETSISITDDNVGNITIESTIGTGNVIFGFTAGPQGTNFLEPVTFTLHWDDEDDDGIVDETNLAESQLVVIKDGVIQTELCEFDDGCNVTTNTFSFEVTGFSVFALFGAKDSDGDGVPDNYNGVIDACEQEDATGFDADKNGCIDQISDLSAMITELEINGGITSQMKNSLSSKIDNASKSESKDNICAAINQLEAFKSQIEAQRGKKISNQVADNIITYTNSIISYFNNSLSIEDICS